MSEAFDLSLLEEDDPNAATKNQRVLKSVERAVRRYCDPSLLLRLDGIALLDDQETVKRELLKLQDALAGKAAEAGKVPHV